MNVKKKPTLAMKEPAGEQTADNGPTRPKNPRASVRPIEGYVLEVDGKFKTEYESSEAAMKAGVELKKKYPHVQVKVYDAKERTRTPVELSE